MKYITFNIFKFSLLILLLYSMFAWFFWEISYKLTILTIFIVSVIFALSSIGSFSLKKSNLISIFFVILIQLYVVMGLNMNGMILAILHATILSIVLLLKDHIKIDLLNFFTRAFATLLSISVITWILFFIGVSLPSYPTDFKDGYYFYDNYYFFLLNHDFIDLPIPRFSSVFLEPGHLGMITSLLLYANQFDFKRKDVWVLLVATLLTFSLAAYVLLLFTVLTFAFLKSKKPMLNLLLLIGFLSALYSYFSTLDNGNNVVNNLIIERMQIEDGNLVGNNRSSASLDTYFEQFMQKDDKFLGIGPERYGKLFGEAGNSGYKVFLLTYGLIGTVLLFLLYFMMVIYNRSKLSLMFLIVYIFSFLQRAYALWDVELLIFITALPILSLNSKNTANVKSV
jgi:hypothetical protein